MTLSHRSLYAVSFDGYGTTEFVTLFAGAIEITVDQKAIVVQAGESVRFQGDTTHAYRNISDQITILHMILYNP